MAKAKKPDLTSAQTSAIIRMAWEDRTTFDEINRKTGIPEAGVIRIMRNELKPSSFRLWRKRVSGRKTKHEKIFRASRKELKQW
ncbi:MAG: TIGR03643 family protein [Verrucomicrobiae bacterium]|nr:TIGR03643 family protein [Verrucomicrobiae bacterium]MBT8411622.1 TIGR03643 family protein [Octadecabacter sp.]NNJ86865.1 TIGR03643 family protein [Akkermansiaceae bacterium]